MRVRWWPLSLLAPGLLSALSSAACAPAPPVVVAPPPMVVVPPPTTPAAPAIAPAESRGLKLIKEGEAVPPPDWSQALVSMYVLAQTRSGESVLVNNDATLHTGERISFHVSVAREASIHLIQIFADGSAALLYPRIGEPERLAPGREYRVPADLQEHYVLDEDIGTEQVVLIASERPLGPAESNLASLVRIVRETGRLPASAASAGGEILPPPFPPQHPQVSNTPPKRRRTGERARAVEDLHPGPTSLSGATRGLRLDTGSSGRALDVKADSAGVAVDIWRFHHLP